MNNVDLSKQKHGVAKDKAYKDYHFRRTAESPGVYVVQFQGSAGKSFVYFLVAKDLRNDWKSFRISANGDL